MQLHPMLVHFPIALLIVAGGLYVFAWAKPRHAYAESAPLIHLLGLIGLGLAMLSGNQAADGMSEDPILQEILEQHELLSYLLLWFYGMFYLWYYLRKAKWQKTERLLYAILYLLALAGVVYTSYLGGQMAHEW
jgi:uncharacterized membrane protein